MQCTRCGHVFTAAPSAQPAPQAPQVAGSAAPVATPGAPANPNNSTLIYGAGNKPGAPPSAATTQVFGAVPQIPAAKPPAAKPPAAKPPSAGTTQVFGAVPQIPAAKPPAAKPAGQPQPAAKPPAAKPPAAKPPAAKPPSAGTTQVFGALPQVPPVAPAGGTPARGSALPSATQVFGAVPQPPAAAPPSAAMETLFEDVPAPDPQDEEDLLLEAAFGSGPVESPTPSPLAPEPGSASRPASTPAPAAAARPFIAVAATTPIELPDDVLDAALAASPRGSAFASITREESSSAAPASSPFPERKDSDAPEPEQVTAVRKPLELPPELLQARPSTPGGAGRGTQGAKGSGRKGLFIGGGVAVLGLVVLLSMPLWRGKSGALSQEALLAREEAVAMLRRDDADSRREALSRLRMLSGQYPENLELVAEVGIALAMVLDDTQVQVAMLNAKVERLKRDIKRLSDARAPVDWGVRVNDMNSQLGKVRQELAPLSDLSMELAKQAVEVMKRLSMPSPPEEPEETALMRLRAQSFLQAVTGSADTLSQAVRLAQQGQQDWSALVQAEYVLNTDAPPNQLAEVNKQVEALQKKDHTFLRLHVLGARLALRLGQLESARDQLETAVTLNPKHGLAQLLMTHVEEELAPVGEASVPSP